MRSEQTSFGELLHKATRRVMGNVSSDDGRFNYHTSEMTLEAPNMP